MSASIFDLIEIQAREAAAQGYLRLKQHNQEVELPGPLELMQARKLAREEAALTDDRQIMFTVLQD